MFELIRFVEEPLTGVPKAVDVETVHVVNEGKANIFQYSYDLLGFSSPVFLGPGKVNDGQVHVL